MSRGVRMCCVWPGCVCRGCVWPGGAARGSTRVARRCIRRRAATTTTTEENEERSRKRSEFWHAGSCLTCRGQVKPGTTSRIRPRPELRGQRERLVRRERHAVVGDHRAVRLLCQPRVGPDVAEGQRRATRSRVGFASTSEGDWGTHLLGCYSEPYASRTSLAFCRRFD